MWNKLYRTYFGREECYNSFSVSTDLNMFSKVLHGRFFFYLVYIYIFFFNRLFVKNHFAPTQVIQTVSAVDRDLPPVGQRFFFKSPKELRNRNFTVRDFGSEYDEGQRWFHKSKTIKLSLYTISKHFKG